MEVMAGYKQTEVGVIPEDWKVVSLGELGAEPVNGPATVMQFMYFSFVTLTTLGYGDILPLSGVAQSLVTIEAVIGVLFPALVIARLVALYSAAPAIAPATGSQPAVASEPTDRG